VKATDLAATIYSPTDLMSVKLAVNGDPDYVKQDGLFLNPEDGSILQPYAVAGAGKPGGILFNSGEIYMNLTFLIPHDLNQATGLVEPLASTITPGQETGSVTEAYRRNVFSGYYRVLVVTNKIHNAVFSQELECVRPNGNDDLTVQPATQASTR
jgi:hypothetical protein